MDIGADLLLRRRIAGVSTVRSLETASTPCHGRSWPAVNEADMGYARHGAANSSAALRHADLECRG